MCSSLKYLADQNVESGATPLVKFRCCDICEKGKGQVDETDLTDAFSGRFVCAPLGASTGTSPLSIRNNKWVKWDYQFVGQYEFTPTLGANIS